MPFIKSTTQPTDPDAFVSESVSEVITEFVPVKTVKHQHVSQKEIPVEHHPISEEIFSEPPLVTRHTHISTPFRVPEPETNVIHEDIISSPVHQEEQQVPMIKKPGKKSSKGLLFVVLLVLLLASIGFGFFALFQRAQQAEQSALASPTPNVQIQQQNVQILPASTPVPSATPGTKTKTSPTPAATSTTVPTKKDVKIRIENGTTTAGEAAKWKTFLADLGYTIVSVGNAAQQDATQTTIASKTSVQSFVPQLIIDLKPKATTTEATTPLAATTTYDILITIGK